MYDVYIDQDEVWCAVGICLHSDPVIDRVLQCDNNGRLCRYLNCNWVIVFDDGRLLEVVVVGA
jgi:hypothetical protein